MSINGLHNGPEKGRAPLLLEQVLPETLVTTVRDDMRDALEKREDSLKELPTTREAGYPTKTELWNVWTEKVDTLLSVMKTMLKENGYEEQSESALNKMDHDLRHRIDEIGPVVQTIDDIFPLIENTTFEIFTMFAPVIDNKISRRDLDVRDLFHGIRPAVEPIDDILPLIEKKTLEIFRMSEPVNNTESSIVDFGEAISRMRAELFSLMREYVIQRLKETAVPNTQSTSQPFAKIPASDRMYSKKEISGKRTSASQTYIIEVVGFSDDPIARRFGQDWINAKEKVMVGLTELYDALPDTITSDQYVQWEKEKIRILYEGYAAFAKDDLVTEYLLIAEEVRRYSVWVYQKQCDKEAMILKASKERKKTEFEDLPIPTPADVPKLSEYPGEVTPYEVFEGLRQTMERSYADCLKVSAGISKSYRTYMKWALNEQKDAMTKGLSRVVRDASNLEIFFCQLYIWHEIGGKMCGSRALLDRQAKHLDAYVGALKAHMHSQPAPETSEKFVGLTLKAPKDTMSPVSHADIYKTIDEIISDINHLPKRLAKKAKIVPNEWSKSSEEFGLALKTFVTKSLPDPTTHHVHLLSIAIFGAVLSGLIFRRLTGTKCDDDTLNWLDTFTKKSLLEPVEAVVTEHLLPEYANVKQEQFEYTKTHAKYVFESLPYLFMKDAQTQNYDIRGIFAPFVARLKSLVDEHFPQETFTSEQWLSPEFHRAVFTCLQELISQETMVFSPIDRLNFVLNLLLPLHGELFQEAMKVDDDKKAQQLSPKMLAVLFDYAECVIGAELEYYMSQMPRNTDLRNVYNHLKEGIKDAHVEFNALDKPISCAKDIQHYLSIFLKSTSETLKFANLADTAMEREIRENILWHTETLFEGINYLCHFTDKLKTQQENTAPDANGTNGNGSKEKLKPELSVTLIFTPAARTAELLKEHPVTREALRKIVKDVVETMKKEGPAKTGIKKAELIPQLMKFRAYALAAVDELTCADPITTVERYQQFYGYFGHAIDKAIVKEKANDDEEEISYKTLLEPLITCVTDTIAQALTHIQHPAPASDPEPASTDFTEALVLTDAATPRKAAAMIARHVARTAVKAGSELLLDEGATPEHVMKTIRFTAAKLEERVTTEVGAALVQQPNTTYADMQKIVRVVIEEFASVDALQVKALAAAARAVDAPTALDFVEQMHAGDTVSEAVERLEQDAELVSRAIADTRFVIAQRSAEAVSGHITNLRREIAEGNSTGLALIGHFTSILGRLAAEAELSEDPVVLKELRDEQQVTISHLRIILGLYDSPSPHAGH